MLIVKSRGGPKGLTIRYGNKTFRAFGKTIADIKLYILECEGIPVRQQTLIYDTKVLRDGMAWPFRRA